MGFEIGHRVRSRAQVSRGHTRLPSYLQCREGCVVGVLGAYPFPDDRAHNSTNARTEALYTVEFQLGDHAVRADLFEPYLEAST
jgi:hypothetical protein